MIQLYLFIFALVAIVALVYRRLFLAERTEKREFKEQVAARVEKNRKLEQAERSTRFKDEHFKEKEGGGQGRIRSG